MAAELAIISFAHIGSIIEAPSKYSTLAGIGTVLSHSIVSLTGSIAGRSPDYHPNCYRSLAVGNCSYLAAGNIDLAWVALAGAETFSPQLCGCWWLGHLPASWQENLPPPLEQLIGIELRRGQRRDRY